MLGERLGVMDLDDLGQRRPIVLLAEIPAVRPGELSVGHALARVGHALEAEVRGVGENRRQYAAWIVVDLAGTQVPEHRRKPGQRVDFPQELADPDAAVAEVAADDVDPEAAVADDAAAVAAVSAARPMGAAVLLLGILVLLVVVVGKH